VPYVVNEDGDIYSQQANGTWALIPGGGLKDAKEVYVSGPNDVVSKTLKDD
jgi:hypothetical protein